MSLLKFLQVNSLFSSAEGKRAISTSTSKTETWQLTTTAKLARETLPLPCKLFKIKLFVAGRVVELTQRENDAFNLNAENASFPVLIGLSVLTNCGI